MKKIITCFAIIAILLALGFNCFALDFKAGQYFFDNTKLQFDSVKMVLGNNSGSTVYGMTKLAGKNWWRAEVPNDVDNVNVYCFVCGNLNEGQSDLSLENLLNEYNDSSLRRTLFLTITKNVLPGWIFYPLNDSETSSGYWRTTNSYDALPSMTLPVVHINTSGGVPIVSKDYYLSATFWIEDAQEGLATQDSPLSIQIKGRGNYTWLEQDKKPYKIKFAQKQSPLGLDNSKHFILKPDCQDWNGYMRNEMGFELSRQLGMPYTTRQYPVEVMLNGEYEGLYFLCEKIRVENGRVEIMEQHDNDSNPDNATGGWLLELGYKSEPVIAQHENNDPSNSWFAFMSQSPEVLSQVQRNYIHDFIYRADSCIYVPDKNDLGWENYLDINSLARFYVIQEVMENVEAFSGSLFMYKDYGWDEKLKFGPVWDFDNSVFHNATTGNHFIFDYESPFTFLWIKELRKFPRFKEALRMVWKEFVDNNVFENVLTHALQWHAALEPAEQSDKVRWPYYGSNHWATAPAEFIDVITSKVDWLNKQWGDSKAGDVNRDGFVTATDITAIYNYILFGDETFIDTSDVNQDGEITASDITFIYNIILSRMIETQY